MIKRFLVTVAAATVVAVTFTGCELMRVSQSQRTTSLYNYLYPNKANHMDEPSIPVLSLPLKVGVAFVPGDHSDRMLYRSDIILPEAKKMELMELISDQFKACAFVDSIELIPTAYLAPRGGFANLEQIRAMYGVDVIALLSYDQVQFTDEGLLSLTYWTIVGAYVVQGEKNDTRTMLDAAVYDIASRKLLFRAPGISNVKGLATPVNLTEELRRDSELGFQQAATNLVPNVQMQLAQFQRRVKDRPTEYKIEHKPGYTGAGSVGVVEAGFVLLAGVALLWQRRRAM